MYRICKMRELVTFLTAAMLAVVFVACTGKEDNSGAGAKPDAPAKTHSVADMPTGHSGEMGAQQVVGEVIGGAHASVELRDSLGEVHEFIYPEIAEENLDAWDEGDTVRVTYVAGTEMGDSVLQVRNLSGK